MMLLYNTGNMIHTVLKAIGQFKAAANHM